MLTRSCGKENPLIFMNNPKNNMGLFPNLGKAPTKEDCSMTAFKEFDIRTVDPMELVDAATVSVDMGLPKRERMFDMARQMNNAPRFFRSGKIAVEVSFAITDIGLDDKMESWLRMV
jgi:hypothetical protein